MDQTYQLLIPDVCGGGGGGASICFGAGGTQNNPFLLINSRPAAAFGSLTKV